MVIRMAKLRRGYTTGTCAAIAAKAAARMALIQTGVERESVVTPSGRRIEAEILNTVTGDAYAECAVRKDSGDDPDVTNGILVYVSVRLCGTDITIDGGTGVGRITKPGLNQPVGAAAINSVPRRMIYDAVQSVLDEAETETGAEVIISVPGGAELAQKTFNPRLGIEGGISILGTSGIVEPMSTQAVIDTISVELNIRRAAGCEYAVIAPGNYGRDFVRESFGTDIDKVVKCSNYIGEAIDLVTEKGFSGFVLIGHIGKLVKLAAGIMNTHSRNADGRAEIFCANAALCGATTECVRKISECVTTDEMISVLDKYGIREPVMDRIKDRIDYYIDKLCGGTVKYAFVVFSNIHGELCRCDKHNIVKTALKEVER